MSKERMGPNKADQPKSGGTDLLHRTINFAATTLTSLMFLGVMGGGIAALHLRAATETPPTRHPPITVETLRLEQQDSYLETSSYVGRLEPARQTALAFERSGVIVKVRHDEGDKVRAGDVVATLDVAQLEAGRRQLEAQRRELEARRKLARLTLGRQAKLRTKGWATDQRHDEARAGVAELSAAIDRVAAQISGTDIDIRKSTLIAPFNGVIGARAIDEGAVVAAGTPIVTLLEVARRQVRVGLPPQKAALLDPTGRYTLRAGGYVLEGKLAARRPDLQPGTRTVTTLFDVKGGEGLPFGELVTLQLETEVREQGAWLPLAALKEGRKGLWTVMVVEDPRSEAGSEASLRNEAAEILHAKGEMVYVRGTFKPNALVLANGTTRVTSGQRIALVKE